MTFVFFQEDPLLFTEKHFCSTLRRPYFLQKYPLLLSGKTIFRKIRGSPSLILKDRLLLYEKTSFLTYKKFLQTFRSYMKNLFDLLWKVRWLREALCYYVRRLSEEVVAFHSKSFCCWRRRQFVLQWENPFLFYDKKTISAFLFVLL